MKSISFVALVAGILIATTQLSVAQKDAILEAKLQFSSMFMGANNNFESLKGEQYSEDDNWTYYGSEYGLGTKAVTILKSKKDTTGWYCYVKFNMNDDLAELPAVQSGVFEMLNMVVKGGKISGEEETEGAVTRTDLYVKKNGAWLGELVSDGDKKTFHVFLKNEVWQ
jgi:hypothetical protein